MKLDIIQKLKEHDLKVTPQRLTILDTLNRYGHASIDEIYKEVKKIHLSISLATVYKNITSLLQVKLIKELALNEAKSKYEIIKEPHSHLICKKCGSIEDINLSEQIEQNASKLASAKEFAAEETELNIYGLCKNCKQNN